MTIPLISELSHAIHSLRAHVRKAVKVKPSIAIYESIEGADMSCENNELIERLLECEKELETRKDDLDTWTDALEELSEIEDAFATDGKTILDVGTDCVKPLYISLKFKPDKIIGISEDLSVYSFASDLEHYTTTHDNNTTSRHSLQKKTSYETSAYLLNKQSKNQLNACLNVLRKTVPENSTNTLRICFTKFRL